MGIDFSNDQNNYNYQQPAYYQQSFTPTTPPPRKRMTLASGRIVRDEQDIYPNEVPNNGNLAVFVSEDLQTVYLKTWGRSGMIDTNVYHLVSDQPQPQGPNPFDMILERLDAIENFLTTPTVPAKPAQNNQPPKKEEG